MCCLLFRGLATIFMPAVKQSCALYMRSLKDFIYPHWFCLYFVSEAVAARAILTALVCGLLEP